MKISIISPGKDHEREIRPYIEMFEERLAPFSRVEWFFPQSSSMKEEGDAILSRLSKDDYVILLDERGTLFRSEDLASHIEKLQNESTKRLVFIIGGAFGVHEDVKVRANKTLSLSKLVFPHMLVRVILIEQLYRSYSILRGTKYHHE